MRYKSIYIYNAAKIFTIQQTITNYENHPDIETLEMLATALDTDIKLFSLNCWNSIHSEYLPIGFDASADNKYRQSMLSK